MITVRTAFLLALTLLSVSACVVEPVGYDRGGYHDHDRGEREHDYGHRVWRE